MPLNVAVIGAGAAGLNALRHLTARPSLFTALAFEQTSNVGGTWVYTEDTGVDRNGLPIHSSMYKHMTTNLPVEAMAFPDFPFSKDVSSFVKHTVVHKYLEDYADHFQLRDHIKFNTQVELVEPETTESGKTTWNVRSRHVTDPANGPEDHQFDCVMVCNGHYSVPMIPSLPGQKDFKGLLMHSHNYRHPEVFRDMNVLCLGAGPSGIDIALEIAPFAKQVYLSHRKEPKKSPLPTNIRQTTVVASLKPHSAVLTTGEEVPIDAFIPCTGYEYTFPFLAPSCHIKVDDSRVMPLYKHLLHTEYTSLAFIGLCSTVLPFPQFECQVRFTLAAWDGSMKLPTLAEMDADTEHDYQAKLASGEPHRYAHKLASRQWEYNDMLASLAGFPPLSDILRQIYNSVHAAKAVNLLGYKRMKVERTGPDTYILQNFHE
ncbi:Flavin-containing monooxygenase FMO GS-OX5 [Lamellibrachia satsuma]|nr:Flavin-containing monooxygenase FMO GS-OX5 [Lamellibrachia satsuma]